MKLKIDTPVMFSSYRVVYRLYTEIAFEDYATLESAKYMQSLSGGEICQVVLSGNKVVQEIPYE